MDLRNCMAEYFQRPEINALLLEYISNHNLRQDDLNEQQLVSILQDLQLLQPLLDEINQPMDTGIKHEQFQIENNLKNIQLTIVKGRRFKVDSFHKNTKFHICVGGFGQKHRTVSFPVSEQFSLNEKMTFKVKSANLKAKNSQGLELAVVILQNNGRKDLYAIKLVEWRHLLCYGHIEFDIELAPYYHEAIGNLPCAGILSLKLQLSPISQLNLVTERAINAEMELQKKVKEENNNKFYSYANAFWNEYKDVHRSFLQRRVKIYGDSQDKVLIPLNKFVIPLYHVRGIDSPNHALRFCSLIPFEDVQMSRKSIYKRFNNILASNRGSVDDHCHLLCSLLLGFGLKSYVCIGYSTQGEHSWVITQQNTTFFFWECTKGIKQDYFSPKVFNFYKSVHIVYNDRQYYVNMQLDDSIAGSKWNFKDISCWKQMDESFIASLAPYNCQIALLAPTFDCFRIENQLEETLLKGIEEYRHKNKQSFVHDEILSSYLATALANYEIERITGQTFCEQEFQTAIKRYIPTKHTFKAFPLQLSNIDPQEIMEKLLEQPKCKQIMLTRGESINFALRCKLILFPDNVFALWVCVAVRYFQIR